MFDIVENRKWYFLPFGADHHPGLHRDDLFDWSRSGTVQAWY